MSLTSFTESVWLNFQIRFTMSLTMSLWCHGPIVVFWHGHCQQLTTSMKKCNPSMIWIGQEVPKSLHQISSHVPHRPESNCRWHCNWTSMQWAGAWNDHHEAALANVNVDRHHRRPRSLSPGPFEFTLVVLNWTADGRVSTMRPWSSLCLFLLALEVINMPSPAPCLVSVHCFCL